jgi:predicted nucleotidyltransferase
MFTVEQRDALRERLLRLAQEDDRVVAGAIVGSLAVGGGDRFSDIDLTFGIADGVRVADVLDHWTRTLVDELDAVRLAELERGPTTYRVFLLPDALQLDLSMTSAARFRPAGPRFRLLFGETPAGGFETPAPSVAEDLFLPTPLVAGETYSGGASSTRSTHTRVSSAGVSGKRSITSALSATTRSRLPAFARGGRRRRRAASTTLPLRPLVDSRVPTSTPSNPRRSGQLSPPPFKHSCARARRRVYRTLMSWRSV